MKNHPGCDSWFYLWGYLTAFGKGMKAGWEVREGAKAEEHPHIVKMANELDRRYQMSLSKQPLEIGEVHCYNRVGATDNMPDSFVCVRIKNPNPYRIDTAYVKLRWEGYPEEVTAVVSSIPANSDRLYVENITCRKLFGLGKTIDPTECTVEYNGYAVSEDKNDEPLAEDIDARVIRDETAGRVKAIEVDTRTVELADNKYAVYDLYVVFRKQGEIVGVATGYGKIEDIDQPDVMQYVSEITEYDSYDVYVVTRYKNPKAAR